MEAACRRDTNLRKGLLLTMTNLNLEASEAFSKPPMQLQVSGSIAFDTIMVFQGRFKDHILADQVHMLNVAFLAPEMRQEFGGCAANIAYGLLGLECPTRLLGAIGKDGHDYLNKCPKRKAAKEAHASKKRKQGATMENESQRHIAAIINGVMQATRNENESIAGSVPSQIGTNPRMPQHGTHARNASATTMRSTSSSSGRVYDHNGNIVNE